MSELVSWVMLVAGIVGFIVTFPLWLRGRLDERMMLGLTLVLSWAALWYAALTALLVTK